MTDITGKLWPSFLAEVSEQMEAIELALLGQGNAITDVDALFRQFHTIKGGCAMMGFVGMGRIAHAAEDLLDPVRQQQVDLDGTRVEALLAALDGLKHHLEVISDGMADQDADPRLVARLQSFSAVTAATGKMPDNARPAAVVESGFTEINADRVAVLAECCRAVLPFMAVAVASDQQPRDDQLTILQNAALDAGMPALSGLLSRPAVFASAPALRRAVFAEFFDRLAGLQQQTAVDFAVEDAAMLVRQEAASTLIEEAEATASTITAWYEDTSADLADSLAELAIAGADKCLQICLLMQMPASSRILRLCRQILRELRRHENAPDASLAETLLLTFRGLAKTAERRQESPEYSAEVDAWYDSLRHQARAVDGQDDLPKLLKQIRAATDLDDGILHSLAAASARKLVNMIESQHAFMLITADLEAQPDDGEAFFQWLDRAGVIIGSETVFGGGGATTTRVRFLVALLLDEGTFRRELSELDPEEHFYELQRVSTGPDQTAARNNAAQLSAKSGASTIRVDSTTLDQFVNRVGEMVMLRNLISHWITDDDVADQRRRVATMLQGRDSQRPLTDAELASLRALLADLDRRDLHLSQADQRIQTALERMQDDALSLRVVPIGMVFNRLPRVVRDVSLAQGKQVQLRLAGEDVRIDKSLMEILIEPLMHMVRNAVDHGIETPEQRRQSGKPDQGVLTLTASQAGSTLVVQIQDDGRGLDAEKIRQRGKVRNLLTEQQLDQMNEQDLFGLIFLPGFSTSDTVTEVSGRGVGMDVVKTRVLQLGGQIEVSSRLGEGSRFTLRLPISAAIQTVLLVNAGGHRIALPERNVIEAISLNESALQSVQGQACMLLRGATLPVYRLAELLGYRSEARDNPRYEVVVLSDGMNRIGLLVEGILGRPEIFLRDVHRGITEMKGVGGVSILGDGSLVIVADCDNLFELARLRAQSLQSLTRVP